MILLAGSNPDLINFVLLGLAVVVIGMVLRYFRQPYIIAYILAGIMMGKHGMELITDEDAIHNMGELGLILLLFFIGMEISLPNLIKNWKVPTLGTIAQILGSIILVAILGWLYDWSVNRIIVLGFITSLSSSAVVFKLLQDNDEFDTEIGQNVISILLMQDILIVPMLVLTSHLGGSVPGTNEVLLQITGGILIVGLMIWLIKKENFAIPFIENLKGDHELQVLIAFIFCFGFAILTAFFGLSAALGAFVGGIFVNAANASEWFHDSLHSFRVVFVALFFISIGMLIDVEFLMTNWQIVLSLLLVVYIGNHFVNSVVLHYFGRNWKRSLYGGALLAQIGELSFILASGAFYTSIISDFEYQLTVITISLTLLISPFWISLTKRMVGVG